MFSLIAACLIAQAPAPAPATAADPGWHWTRVYGQLVQVWGVDRDGRLSWGRGYNDPQYVAPVELERRKAELARSMPVIPAPSPQSPSVPTLNYGVMADEMRADQRTLRASDPETLRMVTQQAEDRKPSCPDHPAEPERKPNLIPRLENDVQQIFLYAVAACFVIGAVVLVLTRPPGPPES